MPDGVPSWRSPRTLGIPPFLVHEPTPKVGGRTHALRWLLCDAPCSLARYILRPSSPALTHLPLDPILCRGVWDAAAPKAFSRRAVHSRNCRLFLSLLSDNQRNQRKEFHGGGTESFSVENSRPLSCRPLFPVVAQLPVGSCSSIFSFRIRMRQ